MMWNNSNNNNHNHNLNKHIVSEDDSWEVRAIEEDTAGNLLGGCTWPPQSYTCNYCGREFRSAQALGGHMNVHRRDRARLHHGPIVSPASPVATSVVLRQQVTSQDLVAGNGLCLVYPLPDHNAILIPTATLNIRSTPISMNYTDPSSLNSNNVNNYVDSNDKMEGTSAVTEELDLDLRLGRRSP